MRPVRVTALTTGLVAVPLLAVLAFAQSSPDDVIDHAANPIAAQVEPAALDIDHSATDTDPAVAEEAESDDENNESAQTATDENGEALALLEGEEGEEEPQEPPAPVWMPNMDLDLEMARPGDPEAGQAKTQLCAACHGIDGNSVVDMYPRLAGQSERYIAQQLMLIASGQRSEGLVVTMLPFVEGLSEQDMRDIGAYFASQTSGAGVADDAVVEEGTYAGLKFYEIGQKIYRGGDPARGVPACLACHGPSGAGNPGPPYPSIGGQHATYVAQRLQHYQAGKSQEEDPAQFQIMSAVTHSLTEQEIQALASYIQGLHDRADEVEVAAAP